MEKQVNKAELVLVLFGSATVLAVTAFAITIDYSVHSGRGTKNGVGDVIKYRVTLNPAFQGWYGKQVPDISNNGIGGKHNRLNGCRGKDVLVLSRATWFSVCNQQIPHLIELRKVLGQEQLVILATSNETAKYLKNFAAAKGINLAVATQGSGALPVLFCDVRSKPTTIFTDRIGILKLAA